MIRIYTDVEIANLQNLGWRFIRDDFGEYSWVLINEKGFCIGIQQSEDFKKAIAASEEPEDVENPT